MFELTRASAGDEPAEKALADALATVANEAPQETLHALQAAPSTDRDAAIEALAEGMVRASKPDAPLWEHLKQLQGSPDSNTVDFARQIEVTLSQKIAEGKAPGTVRKIERGIDPAVGTRVVISGTCGLRCCHNVRTRDHRRDRRCTFFLSIAVSRASAYFGSAWYQPTVAKLQGQMNVSLRQACVGHLLRGLPLTG